MKRAHRKSGKRRQEGGSALLVTLMVMVGLSLIGLGYVAVSETESAISINERNSAQTREVAEAGVRMIVELFQDPVWGDAVKLLPPNIVEAKTSRTVDLDPSGTYTGYYKPVGLLFDKPHKASRADRFWGDEDHADVWINNTRLSANATAANRDWLNEVNKALFAGDYSAGRITEIKVYAPPFTSAGQLSTAGASTGFWKDKGLRLGLCTIAVTATKCKNDSDADPCKSDSPESRIISRRTVRAVISEWPFPGPSGPVQTNANLGTNGNVQVHWGKITATGSMELKRPFGPLPWHDAWNRVHFEYGYAEPAGADNPWPVNTGAGTIYSQYPWLYAIEGKSLEDPWWEARTRGNYTGDGAALDYMPYPYDNPELSLFDGKDGIYRAVWQAQTSDTAPQIKSVLFPKFDYNFWKDVALTGDDQDNVYYLTSAGGTQYSDKDGVTKDADDWMNTAAGSKAGFYFFETANAQNPQNGGPGVLTDAITAKGNPFQAQGFIYLNSKAWDSAGGAKGLDGLYNSPGEHYRDIGYWKVVPGTGLWDMTGPGGTHLVESNDDGVWLYQDVNANGYFDVVTAVRNFYRPGATPGTNVGSEITTHYFPVPYTPGCTIGTNCSEPHEPYVNYEYNNTDTSSGATIGGFGKVGALNVTDVTIKWSAGNGQILAKTTSDGTSAGTAVTCAGITDKKVLQKTCTSNAYDREGPLVKLDPMLNGVLYVEGQFVQTGNLIFFGSILAQGDFGKAGSPDVWFDERLIKDEWPPREFRFPRVFISALQSD